jgi:hypothetical protein
MRLPSPLHAPFPVSLAASCSPESVTLTQHSVNSVSRRSMAYRALS